MTCLDLLEYNEVSQVKPVLMKRKINIDHLLNKQALPLASKLQSKLFIDLDDLFLLYSSHYNSFPQYLHGRRNQIMYNEFKLIKKLHDFEADHETERLLTNNAGGSSFVSEVFSYLIVKKEFDKVELLYSETDIDYPVGSKITDYVIKQEEIKIGVSVTRAMKWRGRFTMDDAWRLLNKKLYGILNSSMNMPKYCRLDHQILHIWVKENYMLPLLIMAFKLCSRDLKSNTRLLLTLDRCDFRDCFYERSRTKLKLL